MKKDYSTIKTILFVIGLLIIITLAIIIYPIQHFELWQHTLLWVVIAIFYCAVFLPLTIHTRSENSKARTFVGGIIYYRGVIIFAVISAIILVFAILHPVSIALYIVRECAALLLFLLYFFLACFTSEHIREVVEAEQDKLWSVTDLRGKAENLSIRARRLGAENQNIIASAEKFAEDMRYLSPSSDPRALEYEGRIAVMIDQISEDIVYLSTNNRSPETVEAHFMELNSLYEQRKAIY